MREIGHLVQRALGAEAQQAPIVHRHDQQRAVRIPAESRRQRRPPRRSARARPSTGRTRQQHARACRRTTAVPSCQRGPSPNASPSTTTSEAVMAAHSTVGPTPPRGEDMTERSQGILMGVDIGGTGIKGAPVDVERREARGRALPRPHAESGDAEGRVQRRRPSRRPLRLEGSGRRDLSRGGQERRDPDCRERQQAMGRHRTPKRCSASGWTRRPSSSTTPTRRGWPRSGSAPDGTAWAPWS